MIWYVRSISLWLMLATPLANSAIARDRALQDQLSIITASEGRTQQKELNNESQQGPPIQILENIDTQEVSTHLTLNS